MGGLGLGFRVEVFGFRAWGLGLRGKGSEVRGNSRAQGLGCRVRVWG